jgi:hypothetical protein
MPDDGDKEVVGKSVSMEDLMAMEIYMLSKTQVFLLVVVIG